MKLVFIICVAFVLCGCPEKQSTVVSHAGKQAEIINDRQQENIETIQAHGVNIDKSVADLEKALLELEMLIFGARQ
jgi:hypothetical protein